MLECVYVYVVICYVVFFDVGGELFVYLFVEVVVVVVWKMWE